VDDAQIIVNELATNAIEAAPGQWMELQPDGVTISVWDSCPDLPLAPQLVDLDDEGGRGLFVVAMLAAKHGTTRTPARCGKAVWALLATDQDQEAA
jgi:serine/threonine-protein kinase RsbW